MVRHRQPRRRTVARLPFPLPLLSCDTTAELELADAPAPPVATRSAGSPSRTPPTRTRPRASPHTTATTTGRQRRRTTAQCRVVMTRTTAQCRADMEHTAAGRVWKRTTGRTATGNWSTNRPYGTLVARPEPDLGGPGAHGRAAKRTDNWGHAVLQTKAQAHQHSA